jgi:hypothetical protein
LKPYREKLIRSASELRKIVQTLDSDEGIRVSSAKEGSKCFTFLTKNGDKFTVNTTEKVYDKSLRAYVPGGEETWFYTSDIEEALAKVMQEAEKPLRAYLY